MHTRSVAEGSNGPRAYMSQRVANGGCRITLLAGGEIFEGRGQSRPPGGGAARRSATEVCGVCVCIVSMCVARAVVALPFRATACASLVALELLEAAQ